MRTTSKTLILVRHGESEFNRALRSPWTWLSPAFWCRGFDPGFPDAALTAKGERQCLDVEKRALLHTVVAEQVRLAQGRGMISGPQVEDVVGGGGGAAGVTAPAGGGGVVQPLVVVSSPMRRALHTALLMLDGKPNAGDDSVTLTTPPPASGQERLPAGQQGGQEPGATNVLAPWTWSAHGGGGLPENKRLIALPFLRERTWTICDLGSPVHELLRFFADKFPNDAIDEKIDFSHVARRHSWWVPDRWWKKSYEPPSSSSNKNFSSEDRRNTKPDPPNGEPTNQQATKTITLHTAPSAPPGGEQEDVSATERWTTTTATEPLLSGDLSDRRAPSQFRPTLMTMEKYGDIEKRVSKAKAWFLDREEPVGGLLLARGHWSSCRSSYVLSRCSSSVGAPALHDAMLESGWCSSTGERQFEFSVLCFCLYF